MGILGSLFIALAIAVRLNRKIEETFAFAIMMIMIIIYLPARFLPLSVGFGISIVLMLVSVFYVAVKLVRDRRTLTGVVLTWGGLAIVIFFLFLGFYSLHRDFSHPDELYCWGLMAKNFYAYDTLSSHAITAISGDQSPFIPLWLCFVARTWTSFSDGLCYFADSVLLISFLIPVFASFKRPLTAPRFYATVAGLLSLMMLSGMESFYTILPDSIIAAMLCFWIVNLFRYLESGEMFYMVSLILTAASLCLTKRSSVVFASLMVFVSIPVLFKRCKRRFLFILIMTAVTALFAYLGSMSLKNLLIPIAFSVFGLCTYYVLIMPERLDTRGRVVFGILAGAGISFALLAGYRILIGSSDYSYAVLARFMEDLFSVNLQEGFLLLSYGIFFLMFLGLASYLYAHDHKTMGRTTVFCALSMIAYATLMLYLHVSQIGPLNDYRESLIPRYMIPWEILAVFTVSYMLIVMDEHVTGVKLFAAVLVIICISDTGSLYRGLFAKHQCIGFNALADAGLTLGSDDMVYYIDEEPYFNYSDREFYYRSFPAKTNFIYNLFLGTNGRLDITASEFESELKGESDHLYYDQSYDFKPYDYVYIQSCEEDFSDRFGSLFESEDEIRPGTAYYVDRNGDDLVLRCVETR